MKKLAFLIIAIIGIVICLVSYPVQSQAPQSFSYQAIIRDAGGEPISDQLVSVKITLHRDTDNGPEVYCETHSVTTNPLGLVNLQIGQGTVVFGSFPAIAWESGVYYLELELDPAGGTAYVPMGTTQLVSVPYALFSEKTAQNYSAGTGIDITDGIITNTSPNAYHNGDVIGDVVLSVEGIQERPVSAAEPGIGQVLQWNGSQWGPATLAGGSPGWLLTGNSGTDPSVNFLGTTDNQSLRFMVNNLLAGEINPSNGNTFLGRQAGENSTGTQNTATGGQALHFSTAGSQNVAIGWHAGYYLTGGNDNIFIGSSSGPTSSQSIDSSMWLGITRENQPVLYGDLTDGRIGIGATSPHPSAKLEVNSNNKGFLLPRMTISEFQAILNPAKSLLVYSVDDNHFYVNQGTPASPSWAPVNTEWGINGPNIYFLGNNVGIGTNNPGAKLEVAGQVKITGGNPGPSKVLTSDAGGLASWQTPSGIALPFEGSTSTINAAFKITNTYTSGGAIGIYGAITGLKRGIGVYGLDGSQLGVGIGVYGVAQSDSGYAVYGWAKGTWGPTVGVRGVSDSEGGYGVYGIASSTTGTNVGVFGYTKSNNGYSGYFSGGKFAILGNTGIGTITPAYKLDVAGEANLNSGITSGVALRCNGAEVLWCNATYFSWGYDATYNYFAQPVTIGTSSTPAYTLVVNGSAAKTDGGMWSNLSDARLKNLIGNYDRGLEDIVRLQPVMFTYKEGNPRELDSRKEQIGFIAQEVLKVFPEAVTAANDGYLDFNMHPVNVAIVNAIKELKAENDRLKAENQKMNLRLEKIEALMSLLTEN